MTATLEETGKPLVQSLRPPAEHKKSVLIRLMLSPLLITFCCRWILSMLIKGTSKLVSGFAESCRDSQRSLEARYLPWREPE
jgi:hypothetical protein